MIENKRPKMMPCGSKDGFTLIETMIALFILAVGVFAIMSMQVMSTKTNFKARRITESAVRGADQFEKLIGVDYDDVTNGTATVGDYNLSWTVSAANMPIDNVKTIDISVAWTESGKARSASHVYYKAKSF